MYNLCIYSRVVGRQNELLLDYDRRVCRTPELLSASAYEILCILLTTRTVVCLLCIILSYTTYKTLLASTVCIL